MHVAPYEFGNRWNHEPTRTRKLLLHRKEIRRLSGLLQQQGLTLVPLSLYINERGKVKVELGLARGKKRYDKREAIAARDRRRQAERELKERTRA